MPVGAGPESSKMILANANSNVKTMRIPLRIVSFRMALVDETNPTTLTIYAIQEEESNDKSKISSKSE